MKIHQLTNRVLHCPRRKAWVVSIGDAARGFAFVGCIMSFQVIPLGKSGAIAILDVDDWFRNVPVRMPHTAIEYCVRPCDRQWERRCSKRGRQYASTTVTDNDGKHLSVSLHKLLFERDARKPLNGSQLDCRKANWVPDGLGSPRCVICGGRRKEQTVPFDDVHILHHGRLILVQPCSESCQTRARKASEAIVAARDSDGSMVYFAENFAQTRIKIGFTSDIRQRFISLQTGCHERLVFVGSIPGTIDTEREWHRNWHHFRVQGEWFSSKPPIRAAIQHAIGRIHWA